MTKEEVIEFYGDNEPLTFFDDIDYGDSIVGAVCNKAGETQLIYDFDLMIENMIKNTDMDYYEAVEYLDQVASYNLSNCLSEAPIIMEGFYKYE